MGDPSRSTRHGSVDFDSDEDITFASQSNKRVSQHCLLCTAVKGQSSILTCIGCNGQAHIACFIRHYNKEKPKSTCKCAAEWIFNFLKLSHFLYVCHACHEKAGGKSFSPSSSILHNSEELSKQNIACNEMINKTLEQLSADVKQMHIQIMEITAKMNNSVSTTVTFDDLLSQQGTASVSASQPQDAHVNPDGFT